MPMPMPMPTLVARLVPQKSGQSAALTARGGRCAYFRSGGDTTSKAAAFNLCAVARDNAAALMMSVRAGRAGDGLRAASQAHRNGACLYTFAQELAGDGDGDGDGDGRGDCGGDPWTSFLCAVGALAAGRRNHPLSLHDRHHGRWNSGADDDVATFICGRFRFISGQGEAGPERVNQGLGEG